MHLGVGGDAFFVFRLASTARWVSHFLVAIPLCLAIFVGWCGSWELGDANGPGLKAIR
jgi:hypothetical protein